MRRLCLATLSIVALALPTSAERLRVRTGATSPYSECYCRANGDFVPVGQSACVRSMQGPRVATCGMEQNVTSWTFTEKPCPET